MFEWNEVYYKLKKRISQRACVYYVDALAHVEAIGVPCWNSYFHVATPDWMNHSDIETFGRSPLGNNEGS